MSEGRLSVVAPVYAGGWLSGILVAALLPAESVAQFSSGAEHHFRTLDLDVAAGVGNALTSPRRSALAPKTWRNACLRIEASGLYDSNALRNDLVGGLWRGDVLSEELRGATQVNLKGNNRAGYAIDMRATYAWGDSLFGDGSLKPMISLATHSAMGLRFTDDLYNLTFFGNTAYENKNASIGGTAFSQITYQTFGFGFQHTKSESFLRLELVNGQRGNSADLRQADFFTATDGRFLQLDLDGSYARSDTATFGFGTSSGLGLAISAAVEKSFLLLGSPANVQLSFTDVGFVAWNGDAERVVNNSVIDYQGIVVDNVFDLDGVVLDQAELQDTIGLGFQRGAFAQTLPATVSLRFRTARAQEKQLLYPGSYLWEVAIDQRNLPGYVPHVSITRSFLGAKQFKPEISASCGGFGGFRVGIGAQWLMPRGAIVLRIPNVIGPVSGSGSGAAAMIGAQFSL